ncbi:MAG: CDP-alcohol phosphatidyltransferase [Deltaproteobacteria bacterium]|nr:CDP-alcohol phosphatidyltransferase [Deltaproteobacteria bacterium]
MPSDRKLLKKITPILVYGRPPLVFGGMICAIAVMLTKRPEVYLCGTLLFFAAMVFDLVDGWFSDRFGENLSLAQLADRIMDRVVYSIVFPLVAVGMMWRLQSFSPVHGKKELVHAIFVLFLCVTVLIRDNFAHFMRGMAVRNDKEVGFAELNRLRTIVAAPLGLVLYAHAFYILPHGQPLPLYSAISWLGHLPLRTLYVVEIVFLTINFGSIAGYCRKYGSYCLDDLCLGDDVLRRKILSVFPNSLTLMNAMMGLMAVFFASQQKMHEAYILLIGATVFDKLDGALARKLGLTEPLPDTEAKRFTLGGILDDVADGVSFCIVPAWIFYLMLSGCSDPKVQGLPIMFAAVVYVVAGLARLVYFTLDRHPIPGIFKGMPTPAGALFVTAPLLLLCHAGSGHTQWDWYVSVFSVALMFITAVLMNLYPVKYLHMGRFMDRNPWFTGLVLCLLFVFVFTPWFGYVVFALMALYVLSPIVTRNVDPREAAREGRG